MDDMISRQAAIDAIYETFCYAYCDNCEKEMNEDLCGDCHRKYQNWAASKKIISKTINSLPSAKRDEQITSEMDEIFRIASEIRLAIGCNTSRECWELARKGDIQRMRHGKWIDPEDPTCYKCSVCGEYATQEYGLTEPIFWRFCPNCGAQMDKEYDYVSGFNRIE